MEDPLVLRDLAVVMVAATATALLMARLRLPSVLGYLAAGVLIGPHTAPARLVADGGSVRALAELGVVFLLFVLGLEFHLGKLKRIGRGLVLAGILEVGATFALGFGAAALLGWPLVDSLFAAGMVAVSSTMVVVKLLEDRGRLDSESGRFVIGLLIVEDLAAILLIAFLSGVPAGGVGVAAVSAVLVRVAVFIVTALVLGLVLVPRLVEHAARRQQDEVLVVTMLGVALAVTLLATLLGFSPALGAFIAGALIAESRAGARVARLAAPFRDAFAAIFFVAVGMLFDPRVLIDHPLPVLALAAVVAIGRPVAIGVAGILAGNAPRTSIAAGYSMGAMSEFGFVIAGVAAASGAASMPLVSIAVAVAVITALASVVVAPRADALADGTWARAVPARLTAFVEARAERGAQRRARARRTAAGAYRGGGALVRFATGFVLLVALSFSARALDRALSTAAGPSGMVLSGDAHVVAWALTGFVAVPVTVATVRAARSLVDGFVTPLVPMEPWRTGLVGGVWLFIAVAFGGFLVAFNVDDLPPVREAAAAAVLVATATYALAARFRALEDRIARAVDSVFLEDPRAWSAEGVEALVADHLPVDTAIEEVAVPPHARAAASRIRDLGLPAASGATVVAVRRDADAYVSPPPDLRLLPGDRVVLIGKRRGLARARAALTERAPPMPDPVDADALTLVEYGLHASSPLVGRSLRDSKLRESTGATVIGLRRRGVPILTPAADTVLLEGDVLLLLGSREQVRAAVFHDESLVAPRGDNAPPLPADADADTSSHRV